MVRPTASASTSMRRTSQPRRRRAGSSAARGGAASLRFVAMSMTAICRFPCETEPMSGPTGREGQGPKTLHPDRDLAGRGATNGSVWLVERKNRATRPVDPGPELAEDLHIGKRFIQLRPGRSAAASAVRAAACSAVALVAVLAFAFTPVGSATAASGPGVSFSPTTLSFPAGKVGVKSDALPVTVTNSGDAPLAISTVQITGTDASDFSQSAVCPISPDTLAAGGSCTIWVAVTPDSPGPKSASLVVGDNAASSPQSVSLSGDGLDSPVVQLAPSSLGFGSLQVGSTSSPQSVTLSNTGTAPLDLSSVTLGGADAADFGLTTTCQPQEGVAVGGSCSASVTFAPQSSGAKAATILFTDGAAGSPQSVALSGTGTAPPGPAAGLAPETLNFGSLSLGATSSAQSVTVTDTGTSALQISSVGIGGADPADFAVASNDCPQTLAASASCSVSVTFTPTLAGSRGASLQVTDNATDSPQSVSLSGSAQAAGTYLSDDFESGSLGTWTQQTAPGSSISLDTSTANSGTSSVRLTNTNAGYSELYADLAGGGHAQSYTRFCFQIAPGASEGVEIANGRAIDAEYPLGIRRWEVVYDPVTQGLEAYFFNENLDRLDLYAATGQVQTGHWYCAELYMDEETNGSAQLWLNGRSVGTVSGDLSTPNPYSRLYLWNQPDAGTVWFDDIKVANAPIGPTGAGGGSLPGPHATLNPTSLTYPSQTAQTTSPPQTITLTNSGDSNLQITSTTITGANPTDFTIQNTTCPQTLTPTATCTITITFTPTTSGTRTATLTLQDNASDTPQTVTLTGTGAGPDAASMTLSATSLPFGDQAVGVKSDALLLTVSNEGDQPVTISAVGITGADASDFAESLLCPVSPDSLAVGATCSIYVSFTPDSTGDKSATLVIHDDDVSSPQTVALSGTGS